MNLEKHIIDRVNNDERFLKAKQAYERSIRTNNMVMASKAMGEVNKVRKIIENELIEEFSKSEASLGELKSRLSEEDYKNALFYSGSINYLIDWIDILITSTNEIVSKAFPGGRIYIWDNIQKVGKEAKAQLDMLYKGATEMSLDIAENSDELFEDVLNILRKPMIASKQNAISIGDTVKVGETSYKVVKIDRRRKDKYSLQAEGQIPIWVNESNINF